MNLSTSLLGIGFLCLFMAPILVVINKQINKNKQLKKYLLSFGNEQNLHFNHIEITHKIMLGVDLTACKLVSAMVENPNQTKYVTDLQNLKNLTILTPSTKENGIEKVVLELEGKTNTSLIFYDDKVDIGVDALMCQQTAKKWAKIIQK